MPDSIPDDLIDLPGAAKLLHVARQTLLRWVLNGRMAGYRVGHRWRVSRADVLQQIRVWTVSDANDLKIRQEAARPMTRRELAEMDRELDKKLRAARIKR